MNSAKHWNSMSRQTKSSMRNGVIVPLFLGMTALVGITDSYAQEGSMAGFAPSAQTTERRSIVPAGSWMSDFEARLSLAELLSYKDASQSEAAAQLARLVAEAPLTHEVRARIADITANVGHSKSARQLYMELIAADSSPELKLRLADQMITWGDFYAAERIYRDRLNLVPADREILLKLAGLLTSSERYEEAEGIYRRLLDKDANAVDALTGLVTVKTQEKDFAAALALLDGRLTGSAQLHELTARKGTLLLQARRYSEARAAWQQLVSSKQFGTVALIGIGKSYLGENDTKTAQPWFEKAVAAAPDNVEARFFRDLARAEDENFLRERLMQLKSPRQQSQLGGLYAAKGDAEKALACYQVALARDPDFYPARLGRVDSLASLYRYSESIEEYRRLAAEFPGNSRINIGLARVLGWSKAYDDSLSQYGKLILQNPIDPVLRKEMARTAVWAKDMEKASKYYDQLLSPAVDATLAVKLVRLGASDGNKSAEMLAEQVSRNSANGSIYQGYEEVSTAIEQGVVTDPSERQKTKNILLELLPEYRIQKGIALEKEAKLFGWNRRFIHALDRYDELTALQPGNEEALFDKGQTECALGLCCDARRTYGHLLAIDPLHNLAGEALKRDRINRSPALEFSQNYWNEEGRGELARISRYKSTLGVNVPVFGCYNLSLAGNAWVEAPKYGGESYTAYGSTIGFSGTINRYLSGSVGWTRKQYELGVLGVKDTALAHLSINLNDHLRWDINYERKDELYNYFGIRQGGVQSDAWSMGLSGNPSRSLSLAGTMGYLRYNDDNNGQFATLSAGYAFTDHPRIFKVIANAEYRDTTNLNSYVYNRRNQMIDITHPYWTPKDYFGESLTFEWYHDLSRLFFCGSQQHFYDMKATVGTDSENNLSARFEAEWHYEFYERWLLSLKGMINRSREWDAIGGSLDMKYRF